MEIESPGAGVGFDDGEREAQDAVGADGFAADASTAVRVAKDLIQKKRALVNA